MANDSNSKRKRRKAPNNLDIEKLEVRQWSFCSTCKGQGPASCPTCHGGAKISELIPLSSIPSTVRWEYLWQLKPKKEVTNVP